MMKKIKFIFLTFILLFITGCAATDNVSPNKQDITKLIEKNQTIEVVEHNNNVVVSGEYTYSNNKNKDTETIYFFLEDNYVSSHKKVVSSNGTNVEYESYYNGVHFAVEDGVYYTTIRLNGYDMGVFSNENLEDLDILYSSYQSGEEISFKATKFENGNFFKYQFYFDDRSNLLTGYEYNEYSETNELVKSYKCEYEYNVKNYSFGKSVLDVFAEVDDKIALTIKLDPNEETERVFEFTTSKEGVISVVGNSEDTYQLYGNKGCSLNFESLQDIEGIEEVDELTIFTKANLAEVRFETVAVKADYDRHLELIEEIYVEGMKEEYTDYLEELLYEFNELTSFLHSQGYMYQIEYYSNPNATTQEKYSFAIETYQTNYARYLDVLKELSKNSPIKDILFEGFSQEDLESLDKDNALAGEIMTQVEQKKVEYFNLPMNSPSWESEVDKIYVDFVELQHQLAVLNGYDNYYDFASKESYGRNNTLEERENLREYVKKYCLDILIDVNERANELANSFNDRQKINFLSIFSYSAFGNQGSGMSHIKNYFNTYEGSLRDKLMRPFDKQLYVYSTASNPLGTAFCAWDMYYEESILFFGLQQSAMTVVHEFGHSAANYNTQIQSYEIAETHSKANEWLFLNYLGTVMDEGTYELMKLQKIIEAISTVLFSTIIDEFEETIYKAVANGTPYTVEQIPELINEISRDYGDFKLLTGFNYTIGQYIRLIIIENPVYYLSYATAELSSIQFAFMAENESYEKAQGVYGRLLEEFESDSEFTEFITSIGLESTYTEDIFVKLYNYVYGNNDLIIPEEEEVQFNLYN